MNTPNKLTVIRVILIPFFMAFYLLGETWSTVAALVVFALATATDRLDGHLARKNNQITTFGKLMDPLADKILIMSALICFLQRDVKYINAVVIVIILARELIVTGIRLIAVNENTVIAASIWGKAKTVSQFVLTICVMSFEILGVFLPYLCTAFDIIVLICVIVAVALTIVSGCDYVWKSRKLMTFK